MISGSHEYRIDIVTEKGCPYFISSEEPTEFNYVICANIYGRRMFSATHHAENNTFQAVGKVTSYYLRLVDNAMEFGNTTIKTLGYEKKLASPNRELFAACQLSPIYEALFDKDRPVQKFLDQLPYEYEDEKFFWTKDMLVISAARIDPSHRGKGLSLCAISAIIRGYKESIRKYAGDDIIIAIKPEPLLLSENERTAGKQGETFVSSKKKLQDYYADLGFNEVIGTGVYVMTYDQLNGDVDDFLK